MTRRKPQADFYPTPETMPEGEVWINVHTARDDFGRTRFTTFWPEDGRWRGGGLVSAQVSFADERVSARRWRERGRIVRYQPGGGEVPDPGKECTR